VVITTNANQLIDRAFQRRIDVVVNFVPPGPVERASIWGLHLPADGRVSNAFLADIALRCSLTGAQIRNAALAATLIAMDEDAPVDDGHLLSAVEGEYRKAGALSPLGIGGPNGDRGRDVDSFVTILRDAG
jgi:SpoVK/Ycf46/Vps4 family AAA+-type ATPase